MSQPLVKNAANEKQLKSAEHKEKFAREKELNAWREILNLPSGRMVLWNLMGKCKVFGSVWDNSARIHFNAGQQDIGHFIMSEICEADEESFFQMMRENKKENL